MSDFVWISHAPSDSTLADGFLKSDLQSAGDERLIAIGRVARNGGVVSQCDMPTEVWGEVGPYRAHHFPNEWPDICYFSGLWIISDRVARIFDEFELGEGRTSPLRLLQMDRVTPVQGQWLCWNVGTLKEAFLPDRSQHIRPAPGRKWRTLNAADHDLKCSTRAKSGADAWVDPLLRGVLFFSTGLGEALIREGLTTERAGFGRLLKVDVIAV